VYLLLRRHLATGAEGVPLLRRVQGKRAFERTLVTLSWWAARLERLLGTRRLQPQIWFIVFLPFVAALVPVWSSGAVRGPLDSPADPAFVMLWILGGACAL